MKWLVSQFINDTVIETERNLKNSTFQRIPYEEFEEWKYIDLFIKFFNRYLDDTISVEGLEWSTNSVGSFFFKILKGFKKSCKVVISKRSMLKRIHKLFTLPNQNILSFFSDLIHNFL